MILTFYSLFCTMQTAMEKANQISAVKMTSNLLHGLSTWRTTHWLEEIRKRRHFLLELLMQLFVSAYMYLL